ncbi:MAG: TIR domain-containing protein [Elusimicrobia bacterium]|nr:TIR domain-containing protein [Elusimicrobiota bacterium]
MVQRLEEVFVTEGIPQQTFVRPPNFQEILLDIRQPGKPVIIEGQSGTGKTTCVRKVLDEIGDEKYKYLTSRTTTDVLEISKIANEGRAGRFVIDDFHRLDISTQEKLANLAKVAAEAPRDNSPRTKLVLVGINQVGAGLIQLVPDIAKRTGIHRIQPGSNTEISRLISEGCEVLNVTISDVQTVLLESKGDYWLTQQLCQTICVMNDVVQSLDKRQALTFDLNKLRQKVVDRLSAAFSPAVKDFCRGARFRPNNDPYLKILEKVGQQDSSIVDLNELANANEDVRGSVNNVKERRLTQLLQAKPLCARHFYYNQDTKSFAIEDPALFFYLKHLDWTRLRHDCGFRTNTRSAEFDFAISFAGENRELARIIANQLKTLDTHVFFDEQFEVNFLGRAWSTEFERIFKRDSHLVVCLLDENYRTKIWPTFERECFLPRVKDGEVIPIFLDSATFPGIPNDLVGIHFRFDNTKTIDNQVTDEITFKLFERLG